MKFPEIQKEYLFFVQQLLLAQDTLTNLLKMEMIFYQIIVKIVILTLILLENWIHNYSIWKIFI